MIRTFCRIGGPPEPAPLPLSSWPRFPPLAPPCGPPKAVPRREPKPLPGCCEEELLPLVPPLPLVLLLPKELRSLPLAEVPDPGAI